MCLIGQQRTYPAQEEATVDARRQQFVEERCGQGHGKEGCRGCGSNSGAEGCGQKEWGSGFVPRESVAPVRNCSQVDRGVSRLIVDTIAGHLLRTECLVAVEEGGGDSGESPTHSRLVGDKWNVGGEPQGSTGCVVTLPHYHPAGRLHLREAAQMFGGEILSQLKKECGGLQTLLRNWPQVFHGVCKGADPNNYIATGNYYFRTVECPL